MGKNKGNVYCEACKKFHREGLHSRKIMKPLVDGDIKAMMSLIKRSTAGMYLSRDMLGDDKLFAESDIVKEDVGDKSGRNKKENK